MDFKKWKRFDVPIVWFAVLFGLWLIWGAFTIASGDGFPNWNGHGEMRRGLELTCPHSC
jgi:hypothetical protein